MTTNRTATPAFTVPAVVSIVSASRRTLKHGDTFALCDEHGDVMPAELDPAGLFHCDTRHLSRMEFTLNAHRPLLLSSTVRPDNVLLDVDLTNPDFYEGDRLAMPKDTFHVARAKFLWDACWYDLFTLTSYADEPVLLDIAFEFDADFADLFEVRGHRRARRGAIEAHPTGAAGVVFRYASLDGVPRATRIAFDPPPTRLDARRAEFALEVAARARQSIAVVVQCEHGAPPPAPDGCFRAMRRARHERRSERGLVPGIVSSNDAFNAVVRRAFADLAMLTTDTPQGPYPYAGVPWFSTPFGRDGLVTALQTLWFDPTVACGVLRFLAAHQAEGEDPAVDMEPGKILHEMRKCELAHLGEVPFGRYYGSVDATPLFVILAGLYWQRTGDRATLDAILPNVRAALAWIDTYGDRDRDHFVEYARRGRRGLRNQGWKDSEDAIFHADGRLAEGAIALCEVQGYAYLARTLGARLFADLGDAPLAARLDAESHLVRERFEDAFWCDDLGTYALALDGERRPCAVRSSNAGQVLFSGIAGPERAARVARGLFGPELFSGWGIRTIGTREKRFNPTSYHNGSVWPHDNALIGLGLMRYGLREETLMLTSALFDAATRLHLRRLPELFCGFRRRRGKAPTPYPVACAPQAWAAVTPLALLQACLGLEIDAASSIVRLREPRLPSFLDRLELRRLRVGASRLDLLFRRRGSSVAVSLLEREGDAEIEVLL